MEFTDKSVEEVASWLKDHGLLLALLKVNHSLESYSSLTFSFC